MTRLEIPFTIANASSYVIKTEPSLLIGGLGFIVPRQSKLYTTSDHFFSAREAVQHLDPAVILQLFPADALSKD